MIIKSVLMLICIFSFSSAIARDFDDKSWDGWNNPFKMDKSFEISFKKLPLKGNIANKGFAWPGFYWANNRGGIAYRWRAKRPNNFKYKSPSLSELLAMDKKSINELSPAEKYDIFMSRYDYPTVKRVWGETRRGSSDWHGICHGVSPSSLAHAEPQTKTVFNNDGVEITFFASDVKALLAYYYAKVSSTKTIQVGKRCFIGARIPLVRSMAACNGVDASALHIIMSNRLGLSAKGFIADMDRYAQVWNHAALKYDSKIIKSSSPSSREQKRGVREKVLIESLVTFTANMDPQENYVIGTEHAKYDTRKYTYWLDLDSGSNIIGSEWVSQDRPDFLWIKEKDEFSGYWSGINEIFSTKF